MTRNQQNFTLFFYSISRIIENKIRGIFITVLSIIKLIILLIIIFSICTPEALKTQFLYLINFNNKFCFHFFLLCQVWKIYIEWKFCSKSKNYIINICTKIEKNAFWLKTDESQFKSVIGKIDKIRGVSKINKKKVLKNFLNEVNIDEICNIWPGLKIYMKKMTWDVNRRTFEITGALNDRMAVEFIIIVTLNVTRKNPNQMIRD